jgi:hypothetical protein
LRSTTTSPKSTGGTSEERRARADRSGLARRTRYTGTVAAGSMTLDDTICRKLLHDSKARSVVLFDEGNVPLVSVGEAAATDAQLLVAQCLIYEGAGERLAENGSMSSSIDGEPGVAFHLERLEDGRTLAAVFLGSYYGLARLRMRQAREELARGALGRLPGSSGPASGSAPAAAQLDAVRPTRSCALRSVIGLL